MFSYRHAFHAGNHADALKHVTWLATLRHLMRKATPLTLIDTHAGAGVYRLDDGAAQLSGEAEQGVGRLQALYQTSDFDQNDGIVLSGQSPNAIKSEANPLWNYLSMVASFNAGVAAGAPWRVYPGSPFLAHALMTEPGRADVHDRLKLFELHPSDSQALQSHVVQLGAGRRVSVTRQDGFEGLKSLLPPPADRSGSRRAAVLIDPSYELKTDYADVASAVQDSLRRFATGVYLVWYPLIGRAQAHELPRRLRTLAQQAGRPWLHATLSVGVPRSTTPAAVPGGEPARLGLSASGMFVINPPHTLATGLRAALPVLQQALSRGPHADWMVETGG